MSLGDPIPSVVETSDREALEWDRLLELVAAFAESAPARDWIRGLQPSRDQAWISHRLTLTEEMRGLLKQGQSPSLTRLFDPSESLHKASVDGAVLESEEIGALLRLMETQVAWGEFVGRLAEAAAASALAALIRTGPDEDLRPLVHSLQSRFEPDGSLADNASPELRRLRHQIDRRRGEIENSLRQALRRLSDSGGAQDELITIRGERFVIPIKPEFKRRVAGVIHGASSSGQTLYLEPLETIEENNELVRLLEEEAAEIRRIFDSMTREIGLHAAAILRGAATLVQFDTLAAAARFASGFDCVRPRFADPAAPELALTAARHPLLERRMRAANRGGPPAIVPLSLSLDRGQRQLILSGPNTGGKSVTLKTVGLLAMMAQSGMPVPAREAVLPVFDAFLVDIGDAQSIERDLSTFSAHIVNIDRISRRADNFSLVLLDELGSSTSPEEGAALAVAIADWMRECNAWCLISTHYTALKIYAASRNEIANASVGFDERTLAPTYELRLGVPGISAGVNIAQRLGLNPAILERARTQLDHQALDIAQFLDQLHSQLDTVSAERDALRREHEEVSREKQRLDREGTQQWRQKVRDLEKQLDVLLKDFAYQAREAVRAIGDDAVRQKLAKETERRLARLRREFGEQFNATVVAQHSGADKGDIHAQPQQARQIAPGDTVRVKSLGKNGIVQRQTDTNAFEVAIGAMKMRVTRADIAEVVGKQDTPALTPVEAARRRGISVSVSRPLERPEINVIGRTAEEASDEVERFLDQAFLAGMLRVRIVHGTGKGILRRTLRAMLAQHPHVAAATDAGSSEGGAGATVVDLRP